MKRVMIPFLAVLLSGCVGYPQGTDSKKVADAIGTIKPSRKDTCETLKQVAEQSSRIESIRQEKEVIYKAPDCEAAKG